MVCQLSCDCNEREGVEIISLKQFRSLEEFFNKQVKGNIFTEVVTSVNRQGILLQTGLYTVKPGKQLGSILCRQIKETSSSYMNI